MSKLGQALSWWKYLSDKEQDILIELIYNMDLTDYVNMDAEGNILGLKEA